MRIIGITGGIGTGKSTVLKVMKEQFGAYVVEADRLAHRLMEPGEAAYRKIVDTFGTKILREDHTIDRGVLGGIVFQDSEALGQLNSIVHPAVKEYILRDIQKRRKEETDYYVIEAALLIEDGYRSICDELWYIHTDRKERINRLIAGRGGDRKKWEQVIASQSDEAFYRDNCDIIIDNGISLQNTINMVKDLLS